MPHEITTHGARDPFSHLTAHAMHAQAHHATLRRGQAGGGGQPSEFLTRTIKKVLDEETTRLENGLTLLATVGATAPFVGLFGTVWGVYHALVAIGMSGAGTLDKVAGPVGEALIMTGLGLAVAIPAVIGYNWLTRSQPRAGGQARRLRLRAAHLRLDGPAARRRARGRRPAPNVRPLAARPAQPDLRSDAMAFASFDSPAAAARRWPRSTWCR